MPAAESSPEWKQITFRIIQAAQFQDTGYDDYWPADLKWVRDKLKIRRGAPRWAIVVDGKAIWDAAWVSNRGPDWPRWRHSWDIIKALVAERNRLRASAAKG